MRRCPDASKNCDGQSECPHTSSGCVGSINASVINSAASLCREGLTGVFCQLCTETRDRYYFAARGADLARCEHCEDTLGRTFGIAIAILLAALIVAYGLVRAYRALPKRRQKKLAFLSETFTIRNKLKIL